MTWRYVFADLLSDLDIAELPLTGVSMDLRIVVPGSLRASAQIPNRQVAQMARKIVPTVEMDPRTGQIVTIPQSVCHVYQDADIWGSYIVWTATPTFDQDGGAMLDIQGATLESWLAHRLVDEDHDFAQVDQVEIARRLLQSAAVGWYPWWQNADLGIELADGDSGVLRDRSYRRTEAVMVGQRLQELAAVENSFEYRIQTFVDPTSGMRRRRWAWGYPILGGSVTPHVYDMPGNLVSLSVQQDLTAGGTAFWARGDLNEADQTADAQPVMTGAPMMRDDLLAARWPWIDYVSDHQGVTDVDTLDAYATYNSLLLGGMVRTLTATVVLPNEPSARAAVNFPPGRLGDYARLTVVNDWWPLDADGWPTFAPTVRVIGLRMTPTDRDNGVDKLELVLAGASDDGGQ